MEIQLKIDELKINMRIDVLGITKIKIYHVENNQCVFEGRWDFLDDGLVWDSPNTMQLSYTEKNIAEQKLRDTELIREEKKIWEEDIRLWNEEGLAITKMFSVCDGDGLDNE